MSDERILGESLFLKKCGLTQAVADRVICPEGQWRDLATLVQVKAAFRANPPGSQAICSSASLSSQKWGILAGIMGIEHGIGDWLILMKQIGR